MAASGEVGLETLLPAGLFLVLAGALSLPKLFAAMSLKPAQRFSVEGGRLSPGHPADLVLFDPAAAFLLDRFALQSKSKNTPFDQAEMQGQGIATFVGGKSVYERANA